MRKNIVFIVICYTVNNSDETYFIDSVWTSCKKAYNRSKQLNLDIKLRSEYGYGLFQVETYIIST